MKKLAFPLLVIVALAALALWETLKKAPPRGAQTIDCADPVAGCSFVHRGMPAKLRFSTRPEALEPFVLSIAGPNLGEASVSFQMVGMDMGFNRYDLERIADGSLSASVTLPLCTASRVDWLAELDLDGQLYALRFTTR